MAGFSSISCSSWSSASASLRMELYLELLSEITSRPICLWTNSEAHGPIHVARSYSYLARSDPTPAQLPACISKSSRTSQHRANRPRRCSDAGDDDEEEMTVFHFLNCAVLTFGPHVVYYSATPLSEYDTIGTSVKAAVVYLGAALVKLVCLATFLKVPDANDSFDPYQELMKILIGFIDVAGLYFALTQLTHRNISQNHKFQAVGLGWAFADSVLHRLAPLWIGARGLEFTWEYIFQGVEANANLVMTLSLAALGSLMWLRKNKPKTLIPIIYACALLLATMPSITSYLRRSLEWQTPKVVGFELFSSLVMAFISWQLFSACQRPM